MVSLPSLKNLKTSWTKYSIVQVLDIIKSKDIRDAYIDGKEGITINQPNLKSFLGIKNINDEIPDFWDQLYNYPQEKMIFGMMALIMTHHKILKTFAELCASSLTDMKGIFICDEEKNKMLNYKEQTNVRSALVESGASSTEYRRKTEVPYDFSVVFQNPELGPLFKQLIENRLLWSGWTAEEIELNMPQICKENKIADAFSVEHGFFQTWLNGTKRGHYIQGLSISEFFTFKNISINFPKTKEIYFLGENGDGKTLMLMALYLAFRKGHLDQQQAQEKFSSVLDIFRKKPSFEASGIDECGTIYSTKGKNYLPSVYAYGAQRARTDSTDADRQGFMTLFSNDICLTSPEDWLQHIKDKENDCANNKKYDAIYQSDRTLSRISTEKLQKVLSDILERQITIEWNGRTPVFKECGNPLRFQELSEGYKSITIFIVDLIYRLVHEEGVTGENIFDKKSVVLVDEIDLHIHPRWQLKLVPKLKKHFPNIQFFFTTHSPTIIQAASDEALIYRIYRQDGQTILSEPYLRKNLNHLMINTLATSPMFGLESARMEPKTDNYTTASTYAQYRLELKLEKLLQEQYRQGKKFLTDNDIDILIDKILKEDDQNQ